jgi:hypothetical protein
MLKDLLRFVLRETGRKRLLIPVPFVAAKIAAFFAQMPSLVLPIRPLLSVDQVRLLQSDHVVGADALTLADLEIAPHALESCVPSYLARYRAKGVFSAA